MNHGTNGTHFYKPNRTGKITSKPSEEDVFKEMTPPSLGHPVTCIKPMDTSNTKKTQISVF
jgi:hypothetical protein